MPAQWKNACAVEECLQESRHGVKLGLSRLEAKGINHLIHNGRLQEMVNWARKQADYVVLDTPPMLAAADSEAIARMVDTALMVVRADFMLTPVINDCLDNLRNSAPDLAGIVLNNYHGTR